MTVPIYVYQCDVCLEEFEVLQPVSAPPVAECPRCGADDPPRKVTAPVLRFVGPGWTTRPASPEGEMV